MQTIESCISFLLGKAYQQLQQETRQRLAPYGVTGVQYALLQVLGSHEGQSGAQLATRLQLDAATITGVLDRLEQSGLIERHPDPHDRRSNRIFLSPLAKQKLPLLQQTMNTLNHDFDQRMGAAAAQQLRAWLAQIGQVTVSQ